MKKYTGIIIIFIWSLWVALSLIFFFNNSGETQNTTTQKIEEKQINKTKDFIYQSSNKIIPKEIKISSNIKKESPNSWYGYDSEENYNIEEVNQVSPEDKKIIKKINQVEDLLSKIYSQRVKEMYNDRLEVIKNSNYFNELMNNELNILIDDINLSNRI